jgi:hypothetical protein
MRINQLSDNELRELLKAEQAQFKELDKQKSEANTDTCSAREYELLKARWKDSAEQIAFLYKKLHPYFPNGGCGNCGSVTTPILGSDRNHYRCVACGEETIS